MATKRGRLVLGLAAVLVVFAWAASGVPGAGVSRAAVATCGSLSRSAGAVKHAELRDAAFLSAGNLWAVGTQSNSAVGAKQTLTERFNGSTWSAVPSPDQTSLDNVLHSVSMTSASQGWAVGYAAQSGTTYQPLAVRWDGTRWSLASPAPIRSDAILISVDSLADGSAWSVGFRITPGGTRRTLIEHASGGKWTQVPSPNDGTSSTDNTLMAVGGTSATGLWAVGWRESPTGLKPLVLRYDTTAPSPSWVSVSGAGGVPSPGKVDTVLTGIDVRTASDVWAVGYYDSGGDERPLALHWNGSTWSNSPIPGAGLLRKVSAISPGNVWADGTYYNGSENRPETLLVHFDGTKWTTVKSLDAGSPTFDEFIGLATDPAGSSITLVGHQGTSPLIEQASCPTGPVSLPTRTPAAPPPVPAAPGVGPAPSPPPHTPPPTTPVPVKIVDRAAAAGIRGQPQVAFSAAVADFNGDGWPDLFISHHWHPANLYINNHNGTFHAADVHYFSSVIDRHSCLAADFNGDGRQDIFCSVGANRGTDLKSNALYIQQPNNTFVDEPYQWNVSDLPGRGRYSAVLDANNDGRPDIFYGVEPLRADGLPSINRFYLNTGHGSFVDDPAMGLNSGMGSRCAHTVDYNSDGWPDLLVCGEFPFRLHLFENMHGHGFKDVSSILGPPVPAEDAAMVDVNHDSRPDLITLTKTTLAEHLQRANGTFAPAKTILKVKNGVALGVGDVNGDHNPDLYVVGGKDGKVNAPDYLLLGNATGGFKSIKIPETTFGAGNGVFPLDYNRDGLTDFLVLNGATPTVGLVQLLTPVPTKGAGRIHPRSQRGGASAAAGRRP
jgi:FG-GAP-like repeat